MDLPGRTAIVTGSGRGIGRVIALEFAREGANVVCCARHEADVAETVRMIEADGGSGLPMRCDVTKGDEIDALVAATLERFGRIDVLFNNAGSFRAIGALWEVDPEAWWCDVTTNLFGAMRTSRAVLPGMMERNEGVIINMSGGGSTSPMPGGSGYASSKAALLRFSDSLAGELEREGYDILVLSIDPGFVHTEMTELLRREPLGVKWIPWSKKNIDAGTTHPPEECAKAAVRMLKVACPALSGRVFEVGMDFERIAARAEEIKEKDLFTLRCRQL